MLDINDSLGWLSAVFYIVAALFLLSRAIRERHITQMMGGVTSSVAIVLHGYFLYLVIDAGPGQNLALVNIISMVLWLSAVLVLIFSCFSSIERLLIFICPLAALSILLIIFFPASHVVYTGEQPYNLLHILIGILTFSVQVLVVTQTLLLATQDKLLRNKKNIFLLRLFPPLDNMEHLLFRLIWLGFLLLSIVLPASLASYFQQIDPILFSKIVLSIIAWMIFAILLWGHYKFGWRGQLAIRWSLLAAFLLVVLFIVSFFST